MRRGVTGTAIAAVAMAALTASQAPGLTPSSSPTEATPPPGTPISGGSPYYTELPPLVTPGKPGTSTNLPGSPSSPSEGTVTGGAGIPATVLAAYKKAEASLAESHPGCRLPWQLLAAIGQVESGQASRGNVDEHGTTYAPIRGPQLNGNGFANITDTDGGRYDGDTTHDRAVGPMQFIPSTWATWGADGNGDGENNPDNVFDAALAAGHYLCAGGRDLSNPLDLDRAILGYNHSAEYLRTVKSWYSYFKSGHHEVPDNPGGAGTATGSGGPGSGSSTPGGSASKDDKPGKKGKHKPGKKPVTEADGEVKPRPTATATGEVHPDPEQPEPGQPDPNQPDPDQPDPDDSESPTCPTPDPGESEPATPSDDASSQESEQATSPEPADSGSETSDEPSDTTTAPPPSDSEEDTCSPETPSDEEPGDGAGAEADGQPHSSPGTEPSPSPEP